MKWCTMLWLSALLTSAGLMVNSLCWVYFQQTTYPRLNRLEFTAIHNGHVKIWDDVG
jgi:hypothetical protein